MPSWLRWVLALAVACASLGTWLLTSDVWLRGEPDRETAQYLRDMARLRREYAQARTSLTRTVSLGAVRAQLPDPPRLVVSAGAEVPQDIAGRIAAGAAGEYAPSPSPRVPVMIAILPRDRYGNVDALNDFQPRVEFLAPADSATAPFCAVIADGSYLQRLNPRYRARMAIGPLGPCRLWARYGAPGQGVSAWLAAGAMHFARDAGVPEPLPDSLRTRRIFGARRERQVGFGLELCLTSNAERCRQALLQPAADTLVPAPANVLATSRPYWWWWAEWPDGSAHLLAALEAEFGPERFARFWTSAEPVERAFRGSFGLPLEAWVMGRLQSVYGRSPTGPRLAGTTILLSLSTLGLLLAVAVAVGRRRTAG